MDLAKNNCVCICYTDEIDNHAIIKRFEGVRGVFNNATLVNSEEELSDVIDDRSATYTLIALNDNCKECIIRVANLKLKQNMNILNIGVNDITSENRREVKKNKNDNSDAIFDAIGGSSPTAQADAVQAYIYGHIIASKET